MNIRQAMQTGPAKVNELFAKLADTSSGAVKTRDKVFGELKTELELLVDLEERHLHPLLGKHKETKDLVPEAVKANKELRARLKELEGLPKHEDAFGQKLADLQKGFQQHVRDSKKELLPAVQKVLSDEEAASAAHGIEAGRAEAEQAKRDEAERARVEAREKREKAEQQAAAAEQAKHDDRERARAEAREANERGKRETAERAAKEERATAGQAGQESPGEPAKALARSADTARAASYRVIDGLAEGARQAAVPAQDALEVTRNSTRAVVAQGVQATAETSQATVNAMQAMQAEGQAWLSRAITNGMNASGELMRCTSPMQVARVQSDFFSAAMRNWMESGTRILQISQRAAGGALSSRR